MKAVKATVRHSQRGQNGMLLRGAPACNFGSIEEMLKRRDFTINSLYYSVAVLRARLRRRDAGSARRRDSPDRRNPDALPRKDPVRILRAVRFAASSIITYQP